MILSKIFDYFVDKKSFLEKIQFESMDTIIHHLHITLISIMSIFNTSLIYMIDTTPDLVVFISDTLFIISSIVF